MGVSILDIARLAGVSKSTVSAVINRHEHVRKETRERVLDAIRQLDYHPNFAARELITAEPMNIGIVMPTYTDDGGVGDGRYFRRIDEASNLELVSRLTEYVSRTRYGVLVEHAVISEGERRLPSFALSRRVSGVFQISPLAGAEYAEQLRQYVPAVVEIGVPNPDCDSVFSDFERTVFLSVEYLADHGHKRIAFINCDPASRTLEQRMAGYLSGLRKYGIEYRAEWVSCSRFNGQGGYDAFKKIWGARDEKPTSVICASGIIAGGAVRFMHENGISVPDTVSVISNGDSQLCEFMTPRISVVCRDKDEIAERAFSLMMERLEDRGLPPRAILVGDRIIERESVKRITQES